MSTHTRTQIFWTGSIGAISPQILRWYSQVAEGTVTFDLSGEGWKFAARLLVTILFVALAGYVTLIWKVRNLKEAFLVGLAIPSIILSAGTDLRSVIEPRGAYSQDVATLKVEARTKDGDALKKVRIIAIDRARHTYSVGSDELFLPPGNYVITVKASGFESQEFAISLDPGQKLQHRVVLLRESPAKQFLKGIYEPFKKK